MASSRAFTVWAPDSPAGYDGVIAKYLPLINFWLAQPDDDTCWDFVFIHQCSNRHRVLYAHADLGIVLREPDKDYICL